MSDVSVMSELIDCPQCGLPASKDEYYVVDEESVVCDYCGYSHITKNGKLIPTKGYGSIHLVKSGQQSDKEINIIRFTRPLTLKDRSDYLNILFNQYNEGHSSMYVWNETTHKLETLHGSLPKTFEEKLQDI